MQLWAKAVTEAEDNATIYVMNDLTMNQSARFWDKNLTITSAEGEPYTIKRGEILQPPTILRATGIMVR